MDGAADGRAAGTPPGRSMRRKETQKDPAAVGRPDPCILSLAGDGAGFGAVGPCRRQAATGFSIFSSATFTRAWIG